ncbi:DUF397 domain-containing protein [Actinoplanes sp. NPDC020271]|uniref:DUF397 domain-containing protein n=1 Tax=Actinoplanes sp. NPDC020271 TaxID=3363896 RepID=UPI00378C5BDC
MTDATTKWYKSSFCEASACVEVAPAGERVIVRNSTRPDGMQLRIDRGDWHAFLDGIVEGRFRHL